MKLKDDPKAYAIMGCAMRVHDTLGNGFLESAYADALELEFKRNSIPYVREDEVYIYYGGTRLQTRYRADFTCFDRGCIIELKAMTPIWSIWRENNHDNYQISCFKHDLVIINPSARRAAKASRGTAVRG